MKKILMLSALFAVCLNNTHCMNFQQRVLAFDKTPVNQIVAVFTKEMPTAPQYVQEELKFLKEQIASERNHIDQLNQKISYNKSIIERSTDKLLTCSLSGQNKILEISINLAAENISSWYQSAYKYLASY